MNLVKRMRILAGLSRHELAEKSGFSYTLLTSWENGRTLPSPKKLHVLADALGCTVEELLPLYEKK